MKRLQAMLTYCRPHGGEGERQFVERFIKPYKPDELTGDKGEVLAYRVQVGKVEDAPILWCSHVDTVHNDAAPLKQEIVYDEACGMIYKDDKKMPLGADDGAGVWLMLEMIDAGIAGTYLFHRGEERGGIGSRGIAMHHEEFLKQFKYAVAFDRRGTGDIIVEQFVGQTASYTFAQALADKFNNTDAGKNVGFTYAPSAEGVFTDTANYADVIPECTNVSVGYDNEHSPNETLDVWHLQALRDAVIEAFASGIDLPVARDPQEPWKWSARLPTFEAGRLDDMYDGPVSAREVLGMKYKDLVQYVKNADPEDVAELLLMLAEESEEAGFKYA